MPDDELIDWDYDDWTMEQYQIAQDEPPPPEEP